MNEKMVKVKILKNVGTFMIGQEVEVPESHAKYMCEVRKRNTGNGLEDYRTAMTMEEFEKIKALPIETGGLTIEEARELGVKNTVKVPKEEIERPFHPGFKNKKDAAEGASAKQVEAINSSRKKS